MMFFPVLTQSPSSPKRRSWDSFVYRQITNKDYRHLIADPTNARRLSLPQVTVSKDESQNHWQQKDYKGFNSSTDWNTADFSKVRVRFILRCLRGRRKAQVASDFFLSVDTGALSSQSQLPGSSSCGEDVNSRRSDHSSAHIALYT